mmetsp:Transcript_34625/g.68319  ORF Transcript_34625/g.68319 Transcript_34625/m.68319 type:complete len:127 (-) Transcript_34625:403-783(-)
MGWLPSGQTRSARYSAHRASEWLKQPCCSSNLRLPFSQFREFHARPSDLIVLALLSLFLLWTVTGSQWDVVFLSEFSNPGRDALDVWWRTIPVTIVMILSPRLDFVQIAGNRPSLIRLFSLLLPPF